MTYSRSQLAGLHRGGVYSWLNAVLVEITVLTHRRDPGALTGGRASGPWDPLLLHRGGEVAHGGQGAMGSVG